MNEQQQVSPQDGQLALAMYAVDHIERKYRAWRQANPHVYEAFARIARQKAAEGRSHYSTKAMAHYIREETAIGSDGEPFKINNNYPALIARDLMAEGVVPAGFFALRDRTAA